MIFRGVGAKTINSPLLTSMQCGGKWGRLLRQYCQKVNTAVPACGGGELITDLFFFVLTSDWIHGITAKANIYFQMLALYFYLFSFYFLSRKAKLREPAA